MAVTSSPGKYGSGKWEKRAAERWDEPILTGILPSRHSSAAPPHPQGSPWV